MKAYADDLLITVEDNKILEKIKEFEQVAGFKLNKNKTQLLAKNLSELDKKELFQTIEIEIYKKVKYLGIWLTTKNINLYKDNYEKCWNEIKRNVKNMGQNEFIIIRKIYSY